MAKRKRLTVKPHKWLDDGNAYVVNLLLQGTHNYLYHRYSNLPLLASAGSPERMEDLVWRNGWGHLCIPGIQVYGSILAAAKSLPDTRNTKKGADGLFKSALVNLTDLAKVGPRPWKKKWDYLDRRSTVLGLSGHQVSLKRMRPAFEAGWEIKIQLAVTNAILIPPPLLHQAVSNAGQFIGIGDNHPYYGRFKLMYFGMGADWRRLQMKQKALIWDKFKRDDPTKLGELEAAS